MRIEDAVPGARIIERHKQAVPRTIVEVRGHACCGQLIVVVVNDQGRCSRIKAKSIGRYDRIERKEN